ncbi:HipA domain-containing protein [Chryseolinea lacunae]|uniref:HipA domain-containing protein n=1 Tax=Chryseolinea lacunae TaxID=2801331 RepID=A0ABS1KP03_9BACT|nr:HipA domain-containing protein [Chryseolinea lacunae]MBL0740422.1 HipA domain-containing protein [Chryseolinea lacunae]
MKLHTQNELRVEKSQNHSGHIERFHTIPRLKKNDYYVIDIGLDGDAPKQFIKAYFFERDSNVKRTNRASWTPYIAKSAEKWYPHESVTEYMINKIGIALGLNMNAVKLVVAKGQIRFLSRYFLKPNEVLIHGAEICGEYLDDLDMATEIANSKKTSRELFTFEFTCEAIRFVFPEICETLILHFIKMIVFDAIVGNNDRHFYNWGVINTIKKGGKLARFAPIYDSARGLLWNESEENLVKHMVLQTQGGKKLVNYISLATPRISVENDANVNHFGLVTFVKTLTREYAEVVDALVSHSQEQKVLGMLNVDIFNYFSRERQELISIILKERFETLRNC